MVGAVIICIAIIILYKFSQKSFIVACMSIAGVKFNSSCIILVVLVVNNFVELSHFSFDGAKVQQINETRTMILCNIMRVFVYVKRFA